MGDSLGAVGRLADDLDVGLQLEEHAEAHADDGMVVHDEHADGGRVGPRRLQWREDGVDGAGLAGQRRGPSSTTTASSLAKPVPWTSAGERDGGRDDGGDQSLGAERLADEPVGGRRGRSCSDRCRS
jgi:hypothetical protein